MTSFDMGRIRNVHLVGIGGCGMSAIAKILFELGYNVTGSDIKESANTMRLKDLGIEIFYEHLPSNIRKADLVVKSTAIAKDNPEIIEAESKKIKVIPRAEMLAWIMNQSKVSIAVAGTHGKTTTTSMLSLVFDKCNLKPTYLIGGERNDAFSNAKLGNGNYSIAEADESDGSFLKLLPKISIITNIESDHLDYFGNLSNILEAFVEFANKTRADGCIVLCSDDENNKVLIDKIGTEKRFLTYGFGLEADIRALNPSYEKNSSRYVLSDRGEDLGEVVLNVPGAQNILNSLAVFAVCLEAGLDFNSITSALRAFIGTRRRFQIIGEIDNILIVDDYAHHPTEIKMTLSAARLGWGRSRRILAVFQPHRYSRTMFLKEEFGKCFENADVIIITEIYSAGEDPIPGINGKVIVDEIGKHREQNLLYIPQKEKVPQYLLDNLVAEDMLITLGAGDVFTIAKEVLNRLKGRKENVVSAVS